MKKATTSATITDFINRFIGEPVQDKKARFERENVMGLFNSYLANYGEIASNVEKDPLIVTAPISELGPAHIRLFLSWFVIQKVMDRDKSRYGPVLREFVDWLKLKGALSEKAYRPLAEALAELKGEPERCEELGRLLYEFTQRDMPTYQDWQRDPKVYARKTAVVRALHHKKPKEILDGYFTVARIGPAALWLTPIDPDSDDGEPTPMKGFSSGIGPVQVPAQAAKLARVGDGFSAAIGDMGGFWKLFEVGGIHPA